MAADSDPQFYQDRSAMRRAKSMALNIVETRVTGK
jgi:hypothetical protein